MTSSTRRWNGSTGTTTAGCTASSATSHPPSSKPPTTLNQRHSNRSRHQHEAGNEPETVQGAVRGPVGSASGQGGARRLVRGRGRVDSLARSKNALAL